MLENTIFQALYTKFSTPESNLIRRILFAEEAFLNRGGRDGTSPRFNWITPLRWRRRIDLERNRTERMIGHLKIERAVATRYNIPASSFLECLHVAPIRKRLRHAIS